MGKGLRREQAKVPYTDAELRQFDMLTNRLSSPNQLTRLDARFQMPKFIAKHGKEKCDAMFEVLKRRDDRRSR